MYRRAKKELEELQGVEKLYYISFFLDSPTCFFSLWSRKRSSIQNNSFFPFITKFRLHPLDFLKCISQMDTITID